MNKITKEFVLRNYPRRAVNSHKNLNGRVLIAAGSQNMPGAAILCAEACYRAGAGFVTLAVPSCIAAACAAAVPEALILRTQETEGRFNRAALNTILNYLKKTPHDLILAGPGLGAGAAIVLKLLSGAKLPAVLDADALNFLAKAGPDKLDAAIPHILTPHEGEMKRLLNTDKLPPEAACKLSALTGAVSLLKGPGTTVCYKGETWQNTTGNEGLAKAGSGDVLAGITAGIFAQLIKKDDGKTCTQKAFTAARLGVFLHGAAADDAAKELGKASLMASDVCKQLPYTLKEILEQKI